MRDAAFDAAAWSWVEHLRSGGTTTWRKWRAGQHPDVPPRWPFLPGAAQLEVVRRLAAREVHVHRDAGADHARLADVVAGTPVGGRGLVDVPLPWSSDRPGTGSPAIEPDQLPTRELLRVCVAVIAELFLSAAHAPVAPVRVRRRPWRRAFVVAGTSPHAEAVRCAVSRAGHVQGGRRPTVLVVGAPLDAMMASHWRRRVEGGAGVRWRRVWSHVAAVGHLPPSVDVVAAAESWAERVGAENVHVVLEPEPAEAVAVAGRVLGLPLRQPPRWGVDVVDTDLLRRLNQVLAIRGPQTTRAFLDSGFGLLFQDSWGRPLGVPVDQLGWATEQAEALAARLAGGSFLLHGDPRVVVPSSDPSMPRSVDPEDTLGRALSTLPGCGMLPTGQRFTA